MCGSFHLLLCSLAACGHAVCPFGSEGDDSKLGCYLFFPFVYFRIAYVCVSVCVRACAHSHKFCAVLGVVLL